MLAAPASGAGAVSELLLASRFLALAELSFGLGSKTGVSARQNRCCMKAENTRGYNR